MNESNTDRAQIAQWRADGMQQVGQAGEVAILTAERDEARAEVLCLWEWQETAFKVIAQLDEAIAERDAALARVAEMQEALRLQRELSEEMAGKKGGE